MKIFEKIVIPSKLDANRIIKFWISEWMFTKRLVRKSLTRPHCWKKVLTMRKLKKSYTRMTLICCLVGIGISTFWISVANASKQNPQTAKCAKVKMLQKWNMLESFRNRRDSFCLNFCLELNYFNSDKRVVRDDRFTLTDKIFWPYLPFSVVKTCQGFSKKSFKQNPFPWISRISTSKREYFY